MYSQCYNLCRRDCSVSMHGIGPRPGGAGAAQEGAGATGPPGRCSCPASAAITDPVRGEIICGGCGLVLVQRLEEAHGWDGSDIGGGGASQGAAAAYALGGAPGPAGSLTMHDRGLSTVMGRDVDSGGRPLPAAARRSIDRLRVWDQRSRSKRAASLARALAQLNSLRGKLAVPKAASESAARIYREAVGKGLSRGRTMSSLVAASLYAACRELNIPRTLDDVARAGNVEKRVLSRDLRTIIRQLDLNLGQYDTASFAIKMANNLGLREKTKRGAIETLARADRAHISAGKNPVAQAAAALYMACLFNSEPITQKQLALESGISAVTIRNRVAAIKEGLGE